MGFLLWQYSMYNFKCWLEFGPVCRHNTSQCWEITLSNVSLCNLCLKLPENMILSDIFWERTTTKNSTLHRAELILHKALCAPFYLWKKYFSFKTAFFSIISEIHRFVYSDLQCINFVSSIVSQYKKYKMVLGMRFELQYFLFKVKWVLDMKIIIWLFCYFIYPGCKLMSYDSRNTINTFFTTHFFPLTQRITILKCDNDLFWKPRIKSKTLSCCYH